MAAVEEFMTADGRIPIDGQRRWPVFVKRVEINAASELRTRKRMLKA
jgi:hypothetical protein